MTPELSRAAADAKERLRLEPDDPRLLELIRAAERGVTLSDLPVWAQPPESG